MYHSSSFPIRLDSLLSRLVKNEDALRCEACCWSVGFGTLLPSGSMNVLYYLHSNVFGALAKSDIWIYISMEWLWKMSLWCLCHQQSRDKARLPKNSKSLFSSSLDVIDTKQTISSGFSLFSYCWLAGLQNAKRKTLFLHFSDVVIFVSIAWRWMIEHLHWGLERQLLIDWMLFCRRFSICFITIHVRNSIGMSLPQFKTNRIGWIIHHVMGTGG